MSFSKLHVSIKTTGQFSQLKGRTGLTPNILSRMALCLSIADPSIPNSSLDDEKGQEFSRYTLLGEWDSFFIALLKERLIHDGVDPEKEIIAHFKAHLNRGVSMLYSRVKSLDDIHDLVVLSHDDNSKKEGGKGEDEQRGGGTAEQTTPTKPNNHSQIPAASSPQLQTKSVSRQSTTVVSEEKTTTKSNKEKDWNFKR